MDPLRAIIGKEKQGAAHNTLRLSITRSGAVRSQARDSRLNANVAHTFTPVDMDYLRTLGTAAVSSIVQKSGLNLPFSLGRKLPPLDALSIWTLYDAIKRVYTLSLF
jgi:hypothetical protein